MISVCYFHIYISRPNECLDSVGTDWIILHILPLIPIKIPAKVHHSNIFLLITVKLLPTITLERIKRIPYNLSQSPVRWSYICSTRSNKKICYKFLSYKLRRCSPLHRSHGSFLWMRFFTGWPRNQLSLSPRSSKLHQSLVPQ